MTGVQIDATTYGFLASVMTILLAGAIWGVKRFVEASDRLSTAMEDVKDEVKLLTLSLARDYPTKEEIREKFEDHVENFHRG